MSEDTKRLDEFLKGTEEEAKPPDPVHITKLKYDTGIEFARHAYRIYEQEGIEALSGVCMNTLVILKIGGKRAFPNEEEFLKWIASGATPDLPE